MANTVPASLKTAEIPRFALRAAQLEKPKPVVAYWCNYWILNQILSKNLHNADSEALAFTTGLMDKVEEFKSTNANNDAVTDDIAGKAYIEQFGLETFSKADNAVRANKVTMATADTFQAAGTFLELLTIWGALDTEIATKIKYAKFHAVRILKAIRAGEDPNLSNPKLEPEPEEQLPQLDPNDAEVKALEGETPNTRRASVVEIPDEADRVQARLAKTSSLDESLHPSREASQVRPPRPSITEVPDEAHRIQSNLARMSTKDESLHPSRVPSRPTSGSGGAVSPLAPQDAASFYTSGQHDISPIDAPSERKPSIGGNYFPVVSNDPPNLPSAPAPQFLDTSLDLPPAPAEPMLPSAPSAFAASPPPPPPPPLVDQSPMQPPNLATDNHFLPPPPQSQQPHIPPSVGLQSQPRQPFPTAPAQPQFQPPPASSSGLQHQYRQPQQPQQPTTHNVVYAPPVNHPNPPPPVAHPVVQPPVQSDVVVDEEAMMKAQKHARWAISALNFEDVPTAIRELQGALAVLGGR